MKIKFKKIVGRLTGISTPVFGISWSPPVTDREVAKNLIRFLEDRRALYNPFDIENPRYVLESVLQIREELTNILQSLGDDSEISQHIRAMRAACRKFMNQVGKARFPQFDLLLAALGEMRAIFGVHIAQLSVKYGIDVEDELASILPIEDNENKRSKR